MNTDFSLLLLRNILYVRLVEEHIQDLYKEQEMRCPVHLSLGQEAAAVGVCSHLRKTDKAVTGHRSHAHYLAKGGDLKQFVAEIYGKKTGCSQGRGGSMHLVDLPAGFIGSTPIVGSIMPVGVGLAFATKMNKEKDVTTIFIGDGATEEGVFHESLNFAKLKNLPTLFVCENNYYSVYTPLNKRQPQRRITTIAEAHGLDTYTVFGNDVEEIAATTKKAVDKIREGKGPALIEIFTYRTVEHCGPNPDDNLNYRPSDQVAYWKKQDPVMLHIKKLLKKKIVTKKDITQLTTEIKTEIEKAFTLAKKAPFPDKKELDKHIYAK